MSTLTFLGQVPYQHDFPRLGNYTPVGVPQHVTVAIDDYSAVGGYFDTDTPDFLPIGNPQHSFDSAHGWVSNGAALTIAQAFGALWNVRKCKLSFNLELTDHGFPTVGLDAVQPWHLTLSGSRILSTGIDDERSIPLNFRGFKWNTEFSVDDMDSFHAEFSTDDGDGGYLVTGVDNADWYPGPALTIDIGHIRSGDQADMSNAQVHSYLLANIGGNGIGGRYVMLGSLIPDVQMETGGNLQIRMTGFHSHDLPLRRSRGLDAIDPHDGGGGDGLNPGEPPFDVAGYIKLEPATGEADAFWGYDGKYDTSTGALL